MEPLGLRQVVLYECAHGGHEAYSPQVSSRSQLMPRSDFAPLSVPGWGDEAPVDPAQQPNSLQDFLGRKAAPSPVSQTASSTQAEAESGGSNKGIVTSMSSRDQAALQPVRCPHCGAGLSAAEAKLQRCLGCGKSTADSDMQPMLVHI
jgi:hypothetical protein